MPLFGTKTITLVLSIVRLIAANPVPRLPPGKVIGIAPGDRYVGSIEAVSSSVHV